MRLPLRLSYGGIALLVVVAITSLALGRLDAIRALAPAQDCVWLPGTLVVQQDSGFELLEPSRSLKRSMRLLLGHVTFPEMVVAESRWRATAGSWQTTYSANIVSDETAWQMGGTQASTTIIDEYTPQRSQGVRAMPGIGGLAFPLEPFAPAGYRADLLKLFFKWPGAIPDKSFTLQAFVYPAKMVKSNHYVIAARANAPFWRSDSDRRGWAVYFANGSATDRSLYVSIGNGDKASYFTWPEQIPLQRWTQVGLTIDQSAGQSILYVDGQRVGETSLPLNTDGLDGFALGSFYTEDGIRYALYGALAWPTLFYPPLTDGQMQQLYQMLAQKLVCAGDVR